MKKHILKIGRLLMATALVTTVSCNSFLEEEPKTFLSPKFYFKSAPQVEAAVNGLYTFVGDIFNGDIEIGTQTYIFMDYLPGYGARPLASGSIDIQQAMTLTVAENNTRIEKIWETSYKAIENCNGVIAGIETMDGSILEASQRAKCLGQAHFFRAFHYFNLVRLYGPVPLHTTVTVDLSNTQLPLTSIEGIYAQIEADMIQAETLMKDLPMSATGGKVTLGTVKSMLAKIYLTMAGHPLKKGTEYYQKAYNTAKEVYASKKFSLCATYKELRESANSNVGEYIWTAQREQDESGSPVHTNMLPYPAPTPEISKNSAFGGALAPAQAFYGSYNPEDKRIENQAFFYTEIKALDGTDVTLSSPFIFKFWDADCATSGKSGVNYPLLRYADVLLMMAEAKAQADGGVTSDPDAVEAYYQVVNRARPDEVKPSQVEVNDVLKERFWELCFESQTWYDMLRTRKALNVTTRQIVDLVGYQAPGHISGHPFKESDLLFPYPLRERRLNPNLVR